MVKRSERRGWIVAIGGVQGIVRVEEPGRDYKALKRIVAYFSSFLPVFALSHINPHLLGEIQVSQHLPQLHEKRGGCIGVEV